MLASVRFAQTNANIHYVHLTSDISTVEHYTKVLCSMAAVPRSAGLVETLRQQLVLHRLCNVEMMTSPHKQSCRVRSWGPIAELEYQYAKPGQAGRRNF